MVDNAKRVDKRPWLKIKCWACGDGVWIRHMRWWPFTDGRRHGACAACIALSIMRGLASQTLGDSTQTGNQPLD